jgi:hypothetical protein
MPGRTRVEIRGEDFCINGDPTYAGRTWRGHRIEGPLLNSRMVQATFDDLNSETRARWAYPDTGEWDPEPVRRAGHGRDRRLLPEAGRAARG